MWTCSFSCLSFLGSLDLAAVYAESSIFHSIVKCLSFQGLVFHDHTEQHFGSIFFPSLLCLHSPSYSRAPKDLGYFLLPNFNKRPTSVSAKAGRRRVGTQIGTRWLWNLEFPIEAKEKDWRA